MNHSPFLCGCAPKFDPTGQGEKPFSCRAKEQGVVIADCHMKWVTPLLKGAIDHTGLDVTKIKMPPPTVSSDGTGTKVLDYTIPPRGTVIEPVVPSNPHVGG